jgi:hypothetical protein
MPSGVIYLIGVVAIFGLLGALFYFNVLDATPVEAIQGFLEKTNCFPDGSCLTVLIEQPQAGNQQPPVDEVIEVEKVKIVDDEYVTETEKVVIENIEGVIQIEKEDPRGVKVQGYVIIHNAVTNLPIKPYVYNVMVEIECDEELNETDDGYNFCATKSIFGRVQTSDAGLGEDGKDLGGYFEYVWHPKFADSQGFYNVSILVTSDQKNQYGQYDNYTNEYTFQLIEG